MKLKSILSLLILILICSGSFAAEWNVVDAGAVGDGITDNTAIFQKLIDDASKAGGGIVNVPAGKFRINGNLVIPSGVILQGTWRTAPSVRDRNLDTLVGSVLLAYAGRGSYEGEPFINLKGHASAISGLIIAYPEWKKTDVPPVPYPPCIYSNFTENVAVIDCCILYAYEAIRLQRAARHLIRNVQGYPSWRGLYVDECYDIGRIENVHFCPVGIGGYKVTDPYCKWVNENGVAFEFARTDWQYVVNTFCFGYGVGYKFSESAHGSCNGNFLGIGADSTRRPILVEQAASYGLLITNGEFVGQWNTTESIGLEILEKCSGKISLSNCSFWGTFDKVIWAKGQNAQLTSTGCAFLSWDAAGNGMPAIDIDGGRAILQGNTFNEEKLHVRVGKNVKSAMLIGNQATGGFSVVNNAGKSTSSVANEQPRVAWTDAAKAYYRLAIGAEGDDRFTRRWQSAEKAAEIGPDGTKRWSGPGSQFELPALAGKTYAVTLDVTVPEYALKPGAGVYYDKTQVMKFDKPGRQIKTFNVTAAQAPIVLKMECKNWVPKECIPNHGDDRTLGVAAHSITMKVKGNTSPRIFNANTGEWSVVKAKK